MEVTTTPAPVATRDEAPWPFPRRFVALFTSPKALFEHLEHRPTWLVPLLVTLALVATYIVVLWNPVILPNMLVRFEPASKQMQTWPVPGGAGDPRVMVVGKGDVLWFGEGPIGRVARVQPTSRN